MGASDARGREVVVEKVRIAEEVRAADADVDAADDDDDEDAIEVEDTEGMGRAGVVIVLEDWAAARCNLESDAARSAP